MATMTRKAPNVKAKSAKPAAVVSLCLSIDHQAYVVEVIPAGEFGTRAFRLVKKSGAGAVYDVIRTHDGIVQCDCPSYEVTYKGTYSTCKHGSAMVAVGLLDAPAWQAPSDTQICVSQPTPAVALLPANLPEAKRLPAVALVPANLPEREIVAPTPCCPADEPAPCMECIPPSPLPAPIDPPADREPGSDDDQCEGIWNAIVPAGSHTAAEIVSPELPQNIGEVSPSARRFGAGILDDADPLPSIFRNAPENSAAAPIAKDTQTASIPLTPVKVAPLPDGRYQLDELVDGQAAMLRGVGNPAFALMADRLAALASEIRLTQASSVSEFEGRMRVLETGYRDGLRDEGYAVGYERGRQDAR